MTAGVATKATVGRPTRGRWTPSVRREFLWALVFLAPWIFGFIVFTGGPMIASFILSLTDYNPLKANFDFVGFANYDRMMSDPRIRLSLENTIFFTVLYVPLSVMVGIGLAMMLLRVGRAAGFFRTVFYLPSITPAVAVGTLFLLILNGFNGLLNQALGMIGINGPSWINDPDWIKPGIVIMILWSVGSTVVILFAALKNVPTDMYEAARIDGANAWQQFRNITVPFISGALFFVIIIHTISALQLFAEVYTMFFGAQPTSAGSRAALFYVIYLFRNAFEFHGMGYASAMAWLLFLVIMVITVIQLRVSRRWVYYEGE